MDDNQDSVMLALLPINSDWCQQDCPHLTLVYAGLVKDLKPMAFNDLAKDASTLATMARPITLRTRGTDVFGPDDAKVDVIKLQPTPELMAMRRIVEKWNASEFDFNPHVTIGPMSNGIPEIPTHIAFNKVMVGWGNDQLVFSLNY